MPHFQAIGLSPEKKNDAMYAVPVFPVPFPLPATNAAGRTFAPEDTAVSVTARSLSDPIPVPGRTRSKGSLLLRDGAVPSPGG